MVDLAASVFRDFVTDGIPASGANKPLKSKIRAWGTYLEAGVGSALANGGLIYSTRVLLFADLAHGANSSAWVYADATAAFNGIYQKSGASGSGSWSRIADLPYSFIQATDVGAGTPNAIVATTAIPVPSADAYALVAMSVFQTNAGSPVTIAFNGDAALTIKTSAGNNVVAGGLIAGMVIAGYKSGSTFRLLSDPASAAIQTAAEAAAAAASGSAIAAAASAAQAAAAALLTTAQGRLTLTSLVPVTTSDVAGATSIYYTPAAGNLVPIWSGTAFTNTVFTELTLALDPTAAHTGYQQSGKIFDLFVINDASTIRLVSGPAWTSDTSRGTGAGTTELQLFNGIWTNKNALAAARFGSASGNTVAVSANRATYVGSFRATADGQASDTLLLRHLYNVYNQAARLMRRIDPAATWNYATAAFRQANANAANQIDFLLGLSGAMVEAEVMVPVFNNTATVRSVTPGLGIDSTSANSATEADSASPTSTNIVSAKAKYQGYPGLGRHYVAWLEQGAGTDIQTWCGTIGPWVGGLTGVVYA